MSETRVCPVCGGSGWVAEPDDPDGLPSRFCPNGCERGRVWAEPERASEPECASASRLGYE